MTPSQYKLECLRLQFFKASQYLRRRLKPTQVEHLCTPILGHCYYYFGVNAYTTLTFVNEGATF